MRARKSTRNLRTKMADNPKLRRPTYVLGLAPRHAVVLEVSDAQSGDTHRISLVVVRHNGRQYLLSPDGNPDWAAGLPIDLGETRLRRRTSRPVNLTETPPGQRGPILAAYREQLRESGADADAAFQAFGLAADASTEDIQSAAAGHPIYEAHLQPRSTDDRAPQYSIPGERGEMPVYLAVPEGDGPWPGVILVHDIFGMTTDLKNQADWLASEGFIAAAPDLQYWGLQLRCLFATLRQMSARKGSLFNDMVTVQSWLASREDCTGKIGVMGFCLGGGFAVLLSSGFGFDASSVNYGGVPEDAMELLAESCPVVGSFGGKDHGLSEAPVTLKQVLTVHGIDHDVTVYPDAGHGFLNDHDPDDIPRWASLMGGSSEDTGYHDTSANEARQKIVAFFDSHLQGADV